MIRTETIPCNLCGSKDSTFLFEARDRLHGIEGTFSYVRCSKCGLVYMNPQVVPEETGKIYPSDYAPHSTAAKDAAGGIRLLYNRLMKTPLLAQLVKWVTNVKIINSISNRLDQKSRILDIGCGAGGFLNRVKTEKGCEVFGVDISEAAVDAAQNSFGLDIFKGTITEAPFEDASFDVITAWWYLEHVPDPQATAARMSSLLKKNGHCIIGIPNFESFNAKCFKDKWYHLDCPRHLCIWTPSAIKRLLEQYGLTVTRIIYDKTPWGLRGSLQYSLFGDNINPKHRNRIRQSLFLWMLLLPWTILVSLLKKSDIIVVYAKKTMDEPDRAT
ncbi:MAG: class I SAM-dependent methyltransferase [Planctomycetota bacterium]|jgi:SAM-dependent methyltransferase